MSFDRRSTPRARRLAVRPAVATENTTAAPVRCRGRAAIALSAPYIDVLDDYAAALRTAPLSDQSTASRPVSRSQSLRRTCRRPARPIRGTIQLTRTSRDRTSSTAPTSALREQPREKPSPSGAEALCGVPCRAESGEPAWCRRRFSRCQRTRGQARKRRRCRNDESGSRNP